ncbi:MAG: hypothetical protein SVU88_02615, partial [Candidatus Nanohaloarchaea archaeon]|nr:hypothetical protein [Candidatus Nanohaloarchaea archaeon]
GPADAGDAPQPADDSDTGADEAGGTPDRIPCIAASLDFEQLEREAGEAEAAYYPIYLVETSEGMVAVDGTDGEVKGVEPRLDDVAGDALELLKRGERSRGELVEALDTSLGELEAAVDALAEHGLVAVDGDTYRYAGFPGFVREQEQVAPDAGTVIDAEIDEGAAARHAVAEVGGEQRAVEQVYYPYYTVGERVFDAVRAEEV